MKTINNKIRIVLVAFFAAIMCFASTSLFATVAKAEGESSCPKTGTFAIEDKISLKLNDKGGMRWILKMDKAHHDYIMNNKAVEVGFIIAPKVLMGKADGDYYGMSQKIVIVVDKGSIYDTTDTENDGYYYANGCVVNMLEANRKYDYTAAAYIKNGEKIEKQAAVNENSVKSFYNVSNAAILYSGEDYSEKMLGLTAYDWLGTEEYPIIVSDSERYETLKNRQNSGFKDKYYEISTDVEYNADDVSGIGSNVSRYGVETAPAAKGDLTYTGSAQELVEAGTAAGENCKIMYKIEGGEWGEFVPVATNAGEYIVYYKAIKDSLETTEKSLTVNIAKAKNEITYDTDANGKIVGLDFVYGNKPNETTAKAIAGNISYTYTLVSEDSTADVKRVTVPDGAKYSPWNDNNMSGLYKCLIAVSETDNYKSVLGDRWVRVHKRELDDNGVKYTYNTEAAAYYVAGYEGAATDITVIDKFNDGKHGEAAVTFVKFSAFQDNDVIKKVILSKNITTLDGCVFLNCPNLEYVSMEGVEELKKTTLGESNRGSVYDFNDFTWRNFEGCTKLTTIVVGKKFTVGARMFHGDAMGTVKIYTTAANAEEFTLTVDRSDSNNNNNLLSDKVFYKINDIANANCRQWNFDNDNNIVEGSTHSFKNGKCELCGEYNTAGVTYGYDSVSKTYYVAGCGESVTEVYVLDKYDDGKHGEAAVTFVKFGAFLDNAVVKKVILGKNITTLDGCVFLNCPNLEYVSMEGVEELKKTTLGESNRGSVYDFNDFTWRNFEGCAKLTTIVVGKKFTVGARMFHGDAMGTVKIYTTAANAEEFTLTIDRSDAGNNNNLLSDSVYYFSETKASGAWHYVNGVPTLWA